MRPQQSTQASNPASTPPSSRTTAQRGLVRPRKPQRPPQRPHQRSQQPNPPQFSAPFPDDPHVAIIGGGLAGLACAHQLAAHKIRSTVFDTGQHGVGGRAATRSTLDHSLRAGPPHDSVPPPEHVLQFDHAAQYFVVDDATPAAQVVLHGHTCHDKQPQPPCAQHVARWRAQGVVQPWGAPVGWLDAQQHTTTQLPQSTTPLVCSDGMRSLAQHMAAEVADTGLCTIQRPMWVARMTRRDCAWRLEASGRARGDFDAVVIAHNGKCANRLVSSTRAVPSVLRQLQRLKLSAAWVLMVAFTSDPLADMMQPRLHGMHVRGCPTLAWAGCNNSKLHALHDASLQCWTLISTAEYGRAHKVSQEHVPLEMDARVKRDLLAALRSAVGAEALPPVAYARTQLWGAALPLNSPGVECIWDAEGRVGVCGDWVAGSGIPAALASGAALGRQIAAQRGVAVEEAACLSVGLGASFAAARAAHSISVGI